MAHFRRAKPAHRTYGRSSDKWLHKRCEAQGRFHDWLHTYPAWHDVIYHTRPRRRADKAMERAALLDRVDADEAAWPLAKKPHLYYW